MIIGLSGKQRVGKDTVGHYLELVYGFKRFAFADELKSMAKLLGWDGQKDEKGRKLLQDLGMIGRNYDENIWVQKLSEKLNKKQIENPFENFVITDVRFENEVRWITNKSFRGGIIIRITRPDEIKDDPHPSETELDNYEFDYVVNSIKGDYNSLYKEIDRIIEKTIK